MYIVTTMGNKIIEPEVQKSACSLHAH